MALPVSVEIIAPFARCVISPLYGVYPLIRRTKVPSPRVSLINSLRYPNKPRVGAS